MVENVKVQFFINSAKTKLFVTFRSLETNER